MWLSVIDVSSITMTLQATESHATFCISLFVFYMYYPMLFPCFLYQYYGIYVSAEPEIFIANLSGNDRTV